MTPWLRVFGKGESEPDRAALEQSLLAIAPETAIEWESEERGWLHAEIRVPTVEEPLQLERFFQDEEGIREELQAWAAWVETTGSPQAPRLMQHLIATRQVFTLRSPLRSPRGREEDSLIKQVCQTVCQLLAQATEGVYQVDEQGFFNADGLLLMKEEE